MKKLYTLLFLTTVHFSFAQDLQLLNNTWYLHYITVNDVTYNPPNSNITLTFPTSNSFNTSPCNFLIGDVVFANNYTNFSTSNFMMSLILCPFPDLATFEGMYLPIFTDSFVASSVNLTYNIIDLGGNFTLTINSEFNGQAVYGNSPLSTHEFNKDSFTFYPNPSQDFIDISLNDTLLSEANLEIYNEIGVLFKTEKISLNSSKIDINNLPSGIYFIKITTEEGSTVKKLIKN